MFRGGKTMLLGWRLRPETPCTPTGTSPAFFCRNKLNVHVKMQGTPNSKNHLTENPEINPIIRSQSIFPHLY